MNEDRVVGSTCNELPSVTRLAFSADGQYVVAGGDPNLGQNLEVSELGGNRMWSTNESQIISCVAYHPNGKWIAYGRYAYTDIVFRQAADGNFPTNLSGHAGGVNSIAFNPADPTVIASCGYDNRVKVQKIPVDPGSPQKRDQRR